MNKKTFLITCAFALFFSLHTFSQERRGSSKKIKTLKISFITEKLELTSNEATKFWPIYNMFEAERYTLYHVKRAEIRKRLENLGGIENVSEKQAENLTKDMLSLDQLNYDTNVRYQNALKKIISHKKILQLQMAERDFNRQMIKRYRKTKNKK
ncbi:MAG: sensor of ECF-type sigma factor [Polaribacter sp.]|nr:sensor of ECF-type sigma factor [Polaribacter sp.]MDG1811467.1 sensor of ECF-type sigma factor [Polaribacter sp.]MDG1994043.1 sensor of ECF-type sigma factor [Polaribacter sp.]